MRRSGLFVGVILMFVLALFVGGGVCLAEWEVQESGVTEDLNDICFVDAVKGFCTSGACLFATDDGGETWAVRSDFELHAGTVQDIFF